MAHALGATVLGVSTARLDSILEVGNARALLAYLAVEANRAHPREKLAGMLWPERSEGVARAYLRRLLVNLRRVIGDYQADPPFLRITRQTVQFNTHSDAWVDVTAFLTLVRSRESTDPETIHQLEEAVELCRGGFLEGFSLADSAALEEWVLLSREHFHRQLRWTRCVVWPRATSGAASAGLRCDMPGGRWSWTPGGKRPICG